MPERRGRVPERRGGAPAGRGLWIRALVPAVLLLAAACEDPIAAPGGDQVVVVQMVPSDFALIEGEARRIDAIPKNPNGTPLRGRTVTWSNSAPDVVSVDEEGFVVALAEGRAVLTAEVGGVIGTAEVAVLPPPVGQWRDHTCAVTTAGSIYCWGKGINGQLGAGDNTARLSPTRIADDQDRSWVSVSTGAGHTCALDIEGRIACWGRGTEGQLGLGRNTGERVPTPIQIPFQFRAVTAGARHTCALSARDARTWCWGWNPEGQIGNGTTVTLNTPVVTASLPELAQIDAGGRHTCGVDREGGLWCWGANDFGQIGVAVGARTLRPVQVPHAEAFVSVTAGVRHTCAVDVTGVALCWGDNTFGQLGDGTLQSAGAPRPVIGGVRFTSISAGQVHTCAVAEDQRGFCWGLGSSGQLGLGTDILIANPVPIGGGAVYTRIQAGAVHGCAITFANSLKCWGFGGSGQLGTGTTRSFLAPVDVEGLLLFSRFDGP